VARRVGSPPTRIRWRRTKDRLPGEADPAYTAMRAGLQPGHLGNVGADIPQIDGVKPRLGLSARVADVHLLGPGVHRRTESTPTRRSAVCSPGTHPLLGFETSENCPPLLASCRT
jgi:hypothetical protein